MFDPTDKIYLKINPLHSVDPCLAAPYRRRPTTGEPCPIYFKGLDKKNWFCNECGLIPCKGKTILSDQQILDEIRKGLTEFREDKKVAYKHVKKHQCSFPGCKEMISKGLYCDKDSSLVSARKYYHLKKFGKPAPIEWLHRPREMKFSHRKR